MAKGINLFLILFSALVFVHQCDKGVFVGAGSELVDLDPSDLSAPLENPVKLFARPAEFSTNPADLYVDGAGCYLSGADKTGSADAGGSAYSPRDRLQQIYLGEIGVRERTGRNDGSRVAEYLCYTHLGEGYAWCASFVSWVYGQAGYAEPRTAWSPSLFPSKRVIWERGRGVLRNSPLQSPEPKSDARAGKLQAFAGVLSNTLPDRGAVSLPQKGDVFGIYFNSVKRIAHAGFVDEWGDKYVITVEGNTNEAGSREGDGVYRKRRLISSIYQVASWL